MPGIGISRTSVQTSFEEIGFVFGEIPDVNGQPAVQGTYAGGKYQLTLVGPENEITRAILQVATSDAETAALLLIYFFVVVVPDYSDEAISWITENLGSTIPQTGKAETDLGDVHIIAETVSGVSGIALKITIQPSR